MCGAVSFTARNVPSHFNSCYCEMCRRWTGSRFLGVHLRREDVDIKDETAVGTVHSSEWAERGFCNKCGSALWYALRGTDQVNLSAGLFDDPQDMTLAHEYFVDQKTCVHAYADTRIQMTKAETLAKFAPAPEGEPQ